jgi:hypothetical protein
MNIIITLDQTELKQAILDFVQKQGAICDNPTVVINHVKDDYYESDTFTASVSCKINNRK